MDRALGAKGGGGGTRELKALLPVTAHSACFTLSGQLYSKCAFPSPPPNLSTPPTLPPLRLGRPGHRLLSVSGGLLPDLALSSVLSPTQKSVEVTPKKTFFPGMWFSLLYLQLSFRAPPPWRRQCGHPGGMRWGSKAGRGGRHKTFVTF